MALLAALFLLTAVESPPANAATDFGALKVFTTDGCTLFPNGTPLEPTLWLHCCVAHDLKYWAGGTSFEKLIADIELAGCVSAEGFPATGALMFSGTYAGGNPYLPTSWRWGYGWPLVRGYTPLSARELDQVRALTPLNLNLVPITETE